MNLLKSWFGLGVLAGAILACGDDNAAVETSDTDATSGAVGTSEGASTGAAGTDTGSGTGDVEPLTRLEQILWDLDQAMYTCPQKVWPNIGGNYRARQVLLVSELENAAWLWNDQAAAGDPPQVTQMNLDELPVEWVATFNVGELAGVSTLGISLDETAVFDQMTLDVGEQVYVDFASVLSFHEGFHFLSGQSEWNSAPGSRNLPYPEPWQPRYQRAQLLAALHRAAAGEADLGAAVYWRERFANEFPAELAAIRVFEVIEGSAEYASFVSSALTKVGCEADEATLLAELSTRLSAESLGEFAGGVEPYRLGVVSGMLLRQAEAQGWEQAVVEGRPPTELVLSGLASVAQEDDAQLQADAQAAVEARNLVTGMEIEPMLAQLADPAAARIVVDFGWVQGSFGLGGFYFLADQPGQPQVWLSLATTMQTPSGDVIEVLGETSLISVPTPCALSGGPAVVLTVDAADVAVAKGLATSTAPTVNFTDLEVETVIDDDGLEWICPTQAGGAPYLPLPGLAPRPAVRPHVVRLGSRLVGVR